VAYGIEARAFYSWKDPKVTDIFFAKLNKEFYKGFMKLMLQYTHPANTTCPYIIHIPVSDRKTVYI
jgi:hypothetical protein